MCSYKITEDHPSTIVVYYNVSTLYPSSKFKRDYGIIDTSIAALLIVFNSSRYDAENGRNKNLSG